MKKMKIYTRTGDTGKTSVIGGRLDKDDIRVEAYGTLDEVNSFVGLAMAELDTKMFADVLNDLEKIQHELFDCGGDLATISDKAPEKLTSEAIEYLEQRIDVYIDETPELEKFILPGGSKPAATIHIARTVTRRAERLIVSLVKSGASVSPLSLQYVNRLSDYFFAVARVINFRLGLHDVEYIRSANVFKTGSKIERNTKE
jgi:cob(I)alamin adenosyltransferase